MKIYIYSKNGEVSFLCDHPVKVVENPDQYQCRVAEGYVDDEGFYHYEDEEYYSSCSC